MVIPLLSSEELKHAFIDQFEKAIYFSMLHGCLIASLIHFC